MGAGKVGGAIGATVGGDHSFNNENTAGGGNTMTNGGLTSPKAGG